MDTGTELRDILAAIDARRRGRRVAAFFDVDGAVLAGAVADAFEQRRRDVRSLFADALVDGPAPS